jgi:hypothetical protein
VAAVADEKLIRFTRKHNLPIPLAEIRYSLQWYHGKGQLLFHPNLPFETAKFCNTCHEVNTGKGIGYRKSEWRIDLN